MNKYKSHPISRATREWPENELAGFQEAGRKYSPISGISTSNPIYNSKGSALVIAIIFMVVASILITVGAKLISNTYKMTKEQELYVGEAENVARAGLQDAMAWYRRQGGPIYAFNISPSAYSPVSIGATPTFGVMASGTPYTYVDQPFNPSSNTINAQKSDTLDQTIGIVNEYPLDDQDPTKATLFARYEVKKQANPNATPAPTLDPNVVHDITGNRMPGYLNGDGLVWYVVSTGYIYRREDKTGTFPYWKVGYNTPPNKIISKARFASEFMKLGINMPTIDPVNILGGVYCNAASQITMSDGHFTVINGLASKQGFSIVTMTNK